MRLFSIAAIGISLAACGPNSAEGKSAQNNAQPDPTGSNWEWPAQDKPAPISETAKPLVAAARKRLDAFVVYNGEYVRLNYPGGDVPPMQGVCTDVVIRSLRKAYNFDLQVAVHEDMKDNFSLYPTTWGHTGPDKNIDHRRVPNLEVWFTRAGYALPKSKKAADYLPGDIVAWRLDAGSGRGGPPHIGIISERISLEGNPLVIHNVGGGPEESDMLFLHTITGHYRLKGAKFRP